MSEDTTMLKALVERTSAAKSALAELRNAGEDDKAIGAAARKVQSAVNAVDAEMRAIVDRKGLTSPWFVDFVKKYAEFRQDLCRYANQVLCDAKKRQPATDGPVEMAYAGLVKSAAWAGVEMGNVLLLPDGHLVKAGMHKYIKRTGSAGNYKYWYKNPKTGKLEARDKAPGGEGGEKADGIHAEAVWRKKGGEDDPSENVFILIEKDGGINASNSYEDWNFKSPAEAAKRLKSMGYSFAGTNKHIKGSGESSGEEKKGKAGLKGLVPPALYSQLLPENKEMLRQAISTGFKIPDMKRLLREAMQIEIGLANDDFDALRGWAGKKTERAFEADRIDEGELAAAADKNIRREFKELNGNSAPYVALLLSEHYVGNWNEKHGTNPEGRRTRMKK